MSTFAITIPGLPHACPHCGRHPDHWPLAPWAGQVAIACPSCYSRVGNLVAVREAPGLEAGDQ